MDYVGRSAIKINRAMRTAEVGRYPSTAAAMLDHVPAALITTMTSAQLAVMLDVLWSASRAAKAIAEREALAEGAIWDQRRCKFRELAA